MRGTARAVWVVAAASALGIAIGAARGAGAGRDDRLCDAPDDDESKWRRVEVPGIAVHVPPAFSELKRYGDYLWAFAGHRGIGIRRGEGPDEMMYGDFALLDACETTLGGRPARLSLLYFTIYDPPQAPSGNRGPRYMGFARWPAIDSLPTVTAWIISANRPDIHNLRGVFHSAEVGVRAPPAAPPLCVLLHPEPDVDSILDTASIAMRLRDAPAPWPTGYVVLSVATNPFGALISMSVLGGDLPDSTKRALALLAGTNVREWRGGEAKVKIVSTGTAFTYSVSEALVCPAN